MAGGVVSASDDTTLKIWDLDTGRVVTTLEGHTRSVRSCAVTPDGRHVVSGAYDGELKAWDLDTGHVVTMLQGHAEEELISCWPDDRLVVPASGDTDRVVMNLKGRAKEGIACAVTPDGRRVVSASKTLNVWDLETYRCLATHRGDAAFTAVAATTTTICAGDSAGTLWLLDWPASLMPPPPVWEPTSDPFDPLPPQDSDERLPRRKPRMPRNIILFLAANPSGTSQLALDQECAAIERELRMTANRDDFEFRSKWAVTVDELARHLMELSPTIIHFSGHGSGSASAPGRASATVRNIGVPDADGSSSGIYLHGEPGGSQLVTARALAMMIKSAANSARVVVLNACYSEAQANALRTIVDCVVGMTGAIRDDAARSFAVGFYRALGNRRSVGNAVEHAVATLAAKQLPDEHQPRCRTRDGVDADQIVLGAPA